MGKVRRCPDRIDAVGGHVLNDILDNGVFPVSVSGLELSSDFGGFKDIRGGEGGLRSGPVGPPTEFALGKRSSATVAEGSSRAEGEDHAVVFGDGFGDFGRDEGADATESSDYITFSSFRFCVCMYE